MSDTSENLIAQLKKKIAEGERKLAQLTEERDWKMHVNQVLESHPRSCGCSICKAFWSAPNLDEAIKAGVAAAKIARTN
jgi:hypothetical protein